MAVRRFAFLVVVVMGVANLGAAVPLAAANLSAPTDPPPPEDGVRAPPGPEPPVRLERHPRTGYVTFAAAEGGVALTAPAPQVSHEAAARSFLTGRGALFGLNGGSTVALTRQSQPVRGITANRFQQTYKGVPVFGGEIIVHTRDDRSVVDAAGQLSPVGELDVTPRLSAAEAVQMALTDTAKRDAIAIEKLAVESVNLAVYNPALLKPAPSLNQIVWRVDLTATTLDPVRRSVLVDARRGGIALSLSRIADARNRRIYDANGSASLPGTLRRTEGQAASGITDVDDAYDFSGDTYDFYLNVHGRDSIDGAGMALTSTTRFCLMGAACPYHNAFWNGSQMVYGAGFASADDVVAHELTHGVTDYESQLFYHYQPGAINEALSDAWGEFIDLSNGRGLDTPAVRWLLGEDLAIGAIRNMADPPQYGQPDKMSSSLYACDPNEDYGGVHTNSGVLNKAVSLMVDGGTFNGKTVAAIGLTTTAQLLYAVQTGYLTSASDYLSLSSALNSACSALLGTDGFAASTCAAVQDAVDAVEMNRPPAKCAAPEVPMCAAGQISSTVFFDNLEDASIGNWTIDGSADSVFYPSYTSPYSVAYATSGTGSAWLVDAGVINSASFQMSTSVLIPTGAYFRFDHAHWFDYDAGYAYDGGVVEYSINQGATWLDAGALFDRNGYNSTLVSGFGNPLSGRSAFGGGTNGYGTSRLNLGPLAGKDVRFRFRVGSDSYYNDVGWFIDNPWIYACAYPPRAWMPMSR